MYLSDDSHFDTVSHGKVRMRFADGTLNEISGVLHIPGLNKNSLKKLIDASV